MDELTLGQYIRLGVVIGGVLSFTGWIAYLGRYALYEELTGKEHPTITELRKKRKRFIERTKQQALERKITLSEFEERLGITETRDNCLSHRYW